MPHDHEIHIGPVELVLLQKLANKHWLPTELFTQAKKVPNLHIVWQIESYPTFRTLKLQGALGTYLLALPRKCPCGDGWLSAAAVHLKVHPAYAYTEAELAACLEKLLSSPRRC